MNRQVKGEANNMARRGENIYHRKDGRWEGRYIIGRKFNGKPKFKSIYGTNYSAVKGRLIILKSEQICSGSESPLLIYGNGTLSDWMDYWLEILEKPYIRETTYILYKRNIENHLRNSIGALMIEKITREDIQATVDQLRSKIATSTLNAICRLLKSILTVAVRKNIISLNPYQEIRLPKSKQKPRVLSVGEQKRLEHFAVETGSLEYLTFLYTGVRLGELCAIRYRDIDFETNTLLISHSAKRIANISNSFTKTRLVIDVPKTDSSIREIPIPFFLSKMLQDRMRLKKAADGDFVFQNSMEGPADPRTVQKRFAKIIKKLKINGAHIHTLRHTFAMRFLERTPGAYKALSEILGHSSSAITFQCYDNCTQERKRKSMHSARMIA